MSEMTSQFRDVAHGDMAGRRTAAARRGARRVLLLLILAAAGLCRGANYALLVGVTQYPALPPEKWLKGPENDTRLMRQLLCGERFKFLEANVTVLAGWPTDEAARPTRANIGNAVVALTAKVAKGDQVLLFFSGHGSQQPANPDPADLEPDGLDEIFLPADAGKWDEKKGSVENAVTDGTVKEWVQGLRAKGVAVWALFDCCHSGTMTRDVAPGERVVRQVAMETLVPAARLAAVTTPPAATRGTARQGPDALDLGGGDGDLVAMYAAQSIEPTFEIPLPGPDDPRQGIFTFTLCTVLAQTKGDFTYRELIDRIATIYRCQGVLQPCPLLEGPGAGRLVLGGLPPDERPDLAVYRLADKGLVVAAGILQGLRQGAILEAFPPVGAKDADKPVGYVEVKRAHSVFAQIAPVAFNGQPAPADEALGTGTRCRLVQEAFDLPPLAVALQTPAEEHPGGFRTCAAGTGPAPVEQALSGLLADHAALLRRTDNASRADWLLRLVDGKAHLEPGTGWSLPTGACGPTPPTTPAFAVGDPGDPAAFALQLRSALTRIARARRLMAIAASESLGREAKGQVAVRVEVIRYPDAGAQAGEVVPYTATGRCLHNGDSIAFRITNRGSVPADVTLLFIDSSFGITAVFPEPGTIDDNRIMPEQAIETPRLEVTAETVGPEQLVAIAVRSRVERQDFSCLQQEALGRIRGDPALASPLGELLRGAMSGEGEARGLGRNALQDYCAVVVSWSTLP